MVFLVFISRIKRVADISGTILCVQYYRHSRKFVSCVKDLLTQTNFTPAGLNNLHLGVLKEPAEEQLVLIFYKS